MEEYFCDMCVWNELYGVLERFDDYFIRCYVYVNDELNKNSMKYVVGYFNNWSVLDVWVMCFYKGVMVRLVRVGMVYLD